MVEIISGILTTAFFGLVACLWVTFLVVYNSSRKFERMVDKYIIVSSGVDSVGGVLLAIYAAVAIGTAFNNWWGGLFCVLLFILVVSGVVGSLFAGRYLTRFFEDRN